MGYGRPRICQAGTATDFVQIDAEFASLIPPLSPAELRALHQSLDAEGCRDALILWRGRNLLVDGHNRLRHCRAKGYPFSIREKEFPDRASVRQYLLQSQLGRRNLSATAESYLRGKRYLEERHQGVRSLTSGQSDQKSTAARLAAELRVGEKTIRRDAHLAKAVDRLAKHHGPEVRTLLLARVPGLTKGGIQHLAKLAMPDQEQFLRALRAGVSPREAWPPQIAKRLTVPKEPAALVQALLKQLPAQDLAQVAASLAQCIASGKMNGSAGERGDSPKQLAPQGQKRRQLFALDGAAKRLRSVAHGAEASSPGKQPF